MQQNFTAGPNDRLSLPIAQLAQKVSARVNVACFRLNLEQSNVSISGQGLATSKTE